MGDDGTMAMEKARRLPQYLRWHESKTSFMTHACAPVPAVASCGAWPAGFQMLTSNVFSVSQPVITAAAVTGQGGLRD